MESFEIDKPRAALPFSARLARENGWSHSYSRRVVREYLRFVWLAVRAGHPVTPSKEVDEAWHLHLCYTRSYWDEMCGNLLGKPLHHGPTEGGSAEDAKFGDWYAKTLESYRTNFGEPPSDIWPPAEIRFAPSRERKVDARKHWIVSKRGTLRGTSIAAGLLILPALAGCVPIAAIDSRDQLILGFLVFSIVVIILLMKLFGARMAAEARAVLLPLVADPPAVVTITRGTMPIPETIHPAVEPPVAAPLAAVVVEVAEAGEIEPSLLCALELRGTVLHSIQKELADIRIEAM